MAESAGAKANAAAAGAMGEHASTIMGIGKEAFQTETDGVTKTLYSAEISPEWPRSQICMCATVCPQVIMERTFVKVQENRIEANYPMSVCGLCAIDNTSVRYFDRSLGNFKESKMCTPGHLCFVIPICGQVAKDTMIPQAEPDFLNPCCPFVTQFYPGLVNAEEFAEKAAEAHAAWKAKHAEAVAGVGARKDAEAAAAGAASSKAAPAPESAPAPAPGSAPAPAAADAGDVKPETSA